VEALPAPLRKSDLLEALSHADVLEDSSLRGKARSRLARGRLDIEGGILPTSEELDIAELIIEMVETRTQAKGDSLVQIRQDTTRAIYHARYGMQELCSREASERARRVLMVAAPLSLDAAKLAYAVQAHFGVCRQYDRVDEFDERGQSIVTPGRLYHWPFLVVRVSIRLNETAFVPALLRSLDAYLHQGLAQAYRRSNMPALEVIIRTLSALHVGAIAIVGLDSRHAARVQEFADFVQTLGNVADAGFGVVVFLASGLARPGTARDALDLLSVGRVHEIVPHADSDVELSQYYWGKLPTSAPMPDALLPLMQQVGGHRMAYPLMFCEINRRLHRQRSYNPEKLLDDLLEEACPALLKYVRLYAKAEVEFHESVRYADWLSYRVPVKPKAERQAQGVPKQAASGR
jgi:hypothetical protein